ncbi:MAG: glycosyltransferase family 2 protein [Candidatus Cloacimonetes bacterium]|nr:glycosyltransferase family 2 protein [Candidatus Cloacimonadota bacterium]
MKEPKVVILSLNYNQPEMTINCINAILQMDYKNHDLYVIDNYSIKENYILLKNGLPENYRVHILRTSKNLGYGKGINFGLDKTKKLKPDFWLIMNNDTIIDKRALSELVKTAEIYNRDAIVSGKIYHLDDPNRIQYIGGIYSKSGKFYNPYRHEIDKGQADQEMEMEMIDDIFWLLPRKIYNKLGGYCPYYFMYGEQSDYAEQAKKSGFKLIYTPLAKLWHKGEVSSGKKDNPIAYYWRSKSGMMFIYRNHSKYSFIMYFMKTTAKSIIKVPFFFLTSLSLKSNIAIIMGIIAFIKWFFDRKIDYGYNPFIRRNNK